MLTWKDVVDDPQLSGLPYKIELTGSGRIVMSPPRNKHTLQQNRIAKLLDRHARGGEGLTEVPVDTDDNTKVIDVVWAPRAMIERYAEDLSWPVAPPICIEVISPSNSRRELRQKMKLYFARGARECWLCDESGGMTFFAADGPLPASALCPTFPAQIKI